MKITLEFEHPHELTALLVELASKIEQSEGICEAYEPLSRAKMAQALGPAVNNPMDWQKISPLNATRPIQNEDEQ